MSILYVDDDVEDIEIFQEAVKAVDPAIDFQSASSGKEALAFLETTTRLPEHVILDINMPGMDGKTCLESIRKQKKFDQLNVVIYSTNSFPKDIDEIKSMGAQFVRKANSFGDLCTMISKLVEKEK